MAALDVNDVNVVLALLEKAGTKATRDGFARYGIVAPRAFGVPMKAIQGIAKQLGKNHELALALWDTGWYEARMLVAFVAEPARVTPAEMDGWCKDFDNWAICDTLCMHLFDRTPHALAKVNAWAKRKNEFERRAAFALLASLALHGYADEDELRKSLPLIEAAATDERNFVKKAVNWALRGIGNHGEAMHAEALTLAERLAASENATARWIGRDAARELAKRPPRATPKTARRPSLKKPSGSKPLAKPAAKR